MFKDEIIYCLTKVTLGEIIEVPKNEENRWKKH